MFGKVLKIIIIIVVVIILLINIPVASVRHISSGTDYSNWMKETLDDNARIVDVRMLGAHDAFSSKINLLSPSDIHADSIMKGFTGILLKGFLVRQSKTQTADTEGLLKSGVRYFDIRLTYNEGKWFTKHNFLASDFTDITADIVSFLEEKNGEFLILDFQHINGLEYGSDEDYDLFIEMLETSGLLAYQHYDSNGLRKISYSEITDDKQTSGIVIIDKFEKENKATYRYDTSIRSNWPDMDDYEDVLSFLKNESDYINSTEEFASTFRIMQAVTTMQLSLPGLINSIKTWSLIERASDFNARLVQDNEFDSLIDAMPIVMVDYCNTNENNFIDNIMSIIINKNSADY